MSEAEILRICTEKWTKTILKPLWTAERSIVFLPIAALKSNSLAMERIEASPVREKSGRSFVTIPERERRSPGHGTQQSRAGLGGTPLPRRQRCGRPFSGSTAGKWRRPIATRRKRFASLSTAIRPIAPYMAIKFMLGAAATS